MKQQTWKVQENYKMKIGENAQQINLNGSGNPTYFGTYHQVEVIQTH